MLAFFGYGILFAIGQNMFGGRKYIREKEKAKRNFITSFEIWPPGWFSFNVINILSQSFTVFYFRFVYHINTRFTSFSCNSNKILWNEYYIWRIIVCFSHPICPELGFFLYFNESKYSVVIKLFIYSSYLLIHHMRATAQVRDS